MEDHSQNESQVPLLPSSDNSTTHIFPRLKISEVVKELRRLCAIACPLIISGLLTYGKSAISVAFMGRLGKEELAGGSLAVGFANITGYSILSGLAMGMDPISSQAFGAKQWALMGHTLQRTILILLLCCIPISLLWLNVNPILIFLGQDPSITAIAATYLAFCLPDLLFIALINPIRIYLRSQKLTFPLMLSAAVGVSLHGPVNYLLVRQLGLGIKGAALSAAIMDFNVLLVLVLYILLTGTYKLTWQGWSMEALKEWSTILALAIPNCISVCLEWWWYELMIVMSGLLPNATDAVATMGVLIQCTSLVYILPSSLSMAVSTRVGNELGAGQPNRAKNSSAVSLGCAILTSLFTLAFCFCMRNVWGGFFVEDQVVIALTAAAMPVLGLCELGNCPQTTMCGVLRGSARPRLGANINLGSFYGVGLPVAITMGFFMDKGLLGLWAGLLAAQAACSILMGFMLVKTDWALEAQRAKQLTGSDINEAKQEQDDDQTKFIAADYYDVEVQKVIQQGEAPSKNEGCLLNEIN